MKRMDQQQLIKAAKDGDRKAFEQLYGDYRDKLHFFVLKNVSSKEAAEDIVSEAFLDAMQNIGSLKAEEAFGSWLYSIAYRKCIHHNEESSHMAHFESEEEQELAMSDSALNEPIKLPEDYAVNKQRQEQIKAIIDGLSTEQRSAIILYYFEERSVGEVAKALNIGEGTAKKRLFDARKKIKTKIEKLMKSGTFCLAPLGAVLQSSFDGKYSAGVVKAGAAVKGVSALKIAAVGAAAVVTVGVPVGLYAADKGWGGDAPRDESSISERSDLSSNDDNAIINTENNEPVRIFTDDFLDLLVSSVTFKDFDETWYTIKGDELAEVKEMLSKIEGIPCEDPELTGWYMFDIDLADEISMIHGMTMAGNYVSLDGMMYKNDTEDNGRELAEYFRENGKITATSADLDGTMGEFELVQYNKNKRVGYAVSEAYGLASFSVPEKFADAIDKYDPHPGLVLNIIWSGDISESYPIGLNNVTYVGVIDEREDFASKYLNEAVLACLIAENEPDIQTVVDSFTDLNSAEKQGLRWLAENKFYMIRDGDISVKDFCLELLASLDYHYGTNDGLPEYSLTAGDGTVYQINISGKWIWRGNETEAYLSDDLTKLLDKYKDEIGLQLDEWN